ncbi:DUF2934 domain-containing protein [Roseococcus sp. YIM B11640]|uniref:DUF2934 domain-containing protein n=1 Tax=Roseococcus sp. YIM B11640 TaxID=3133973 RepID=UPI003C798D47
MSDDAQSLLEQRIRDKAYLLWEEAGCPEGDDHRFWYEARAEVEREEAALDKALASTFPSSDPVSLTSLETGTGSSN